MSQGNFTAARTQFESSVKIAQTLGDQARVLEARLNLGMIATVLGDLEGARSGLEGDLQKSQSLALRSDEAICLSALGDIAFAEDDLTLAVASATSAPSKSAIHQLGEKGSIAATQVSLATLALEQSRATQAESLARQAVQEFQLEKVPNQQAAAQDVLAQALLSQHKLNEASTEIAAAEALGANDPPTLLSLAITEARVSAGKGSSAEAIQKLLATSQRAS